MYRQNSDFKIAVRNAAKPTPISAGQVAFWALAFVLSVAWLLVAFSNLTLARLPEVYLRAAFVFMALTALISELLRKPLPPTLASMFTLGVLAANAIALATGGSFAPLGSDVSAALFLVAGLVFSGSMNQWWTFFAPAGLVLLLLPIGVWESTLPLAFGGLLRASLGPVMGFLAGSLLAALQNTKQGAEIASSDILGIAQKSRDLKKRILQMEVEMKDLLLESARAMNAGTNDARISWKTKEFTMDASAFGQPQVFVESEVLSHPEVQKAVDGAMDKVRRQCMELGMTGLRMTLTSPADGTLPMAVRGNAGELLSLLELVFALSAQSIGSGGPDGVVRAAIRPGLGTLTLVIEDNGRGFTDAMLLRTAPGQIDSWIAVRERAKASGWTLSRQARLGVGSRVVIELPRVDAFAQGPRLERTPAERALTSRPSQDSQHV